MLLYSWIQKNYQAKQVAFNISLSLLSSSIYIPWTHYYMRMYAHTLVSLYHITLHYMYHTCKMYMEIRNVHDIGHLFLTSLIYSLGFTSILVRISQTWYSPLKKLSISRTIGTKAGFVLLWLLILSSFFLLPICTTEWIAELR